MQKASWHVHMRSRGGGIPAVDFDLTDAGAFLSEALQIFPELLMEC